jgi:hypothetical protein
MDTINSRRNKQAEYYVAFDRRSRRKRENSEPTCPRGAKLPSPYG